MSQSSSAITDRPNITIPFKIHNGVNYFTTFLIGVVASIFLVDVATQEPFFKGQSLSITVSLVIGLIGVIQWLFFKSKVRRNKYTSAFLISFLAFWGYLYIRALTDHTGYNYTILLVPLLLLMLLFKPLSREEVVASADIFAWAIVVMIVIAECVAILTGYRGLGSLLLRIPFLPEMVGGDNRWVGPFLNPNYAGPVGTYLFVYGLSRTRLTRLILTLVGLMMVILSGSRSAIFGLTAGLAVYFVWSTGGKLAGISKKNRIISVLVLGCVLILGSTLADPTFNGRVPIWGQYLEWFRSHPLQGMGTVQIDNLIASGSYGSWLVHAHNILLDQAGRYGLVGVLLLVSVLYFALSATLHEVSKNTLAGLATVVSFLVIGIVELPESYASWSVPTCWIVIGVLIGSQTSYDLRNPENCDSNFLH